LSLLRSRRQGPIAAIKSLVRDPEALTDEERRVVERKICGLFTEDEVEAVRNYRGVAFGRPPEMLALAARAPASLPNIHGLLVVPRERVRRRAVNMIPPVRMPRPYSRPSPQSLNGVKDVQLDESLLEGFLAHFGQMATTAASVASGKSATLP
jgi:hypothetical protein